MAVLQHSKHLLLVFLLLISLCDCKLEPYRILGVDRQASNQEIRKGKMSDFTVGWARKIKKVQAKKLVKSNKSISRKKFFNIFHEN